MFHVKRPPFQQVKFKELNKHSLLAYAEFPEDRTKNLFDVDPAQEPAEKIRSGSQFLGCQLFALSDRADAPL